MVVKLLTVSLMVCEQHTAAALLMANKELSLTLFFCVVKPLYEQFFDWNCCVDISSEGKIWKSVQNSLFH